MQSVRRRRKKEGGNEGKEEEKRRKERKRKVNARQDKGERKEKAGKQQVHTFSS